jgi:enediyne biosynthesis protein E7
MGPRWVHVIADSTVARAVLVEHRDKYKKGIGQDFARSFLGDGLLTSEGASWETQRAAIQPLFTTSQREAQLAVVREELDEMLGRWKRAGAGDIRIVEEMMRLTLSIAWRLVFGDQIGARDDRVRAMLAVAFDDVGRRIVSPFAVPLSFPTRVNLRVRRALRDLEAIVEKAIERHPSQPHAMLPHLAARFTGKALKEQVTTLLFSAHETTAVALVWILCAAARTPETWSRLAHDDREPRSRLSYTSAVVHETLRLSPPVWAIPRTATTDDVIDNILIPAGAIIVISPYLMHRDPTVWVEPEMFQPDRFLGGVPRDARHCYMPFGVGPRHCVGRGLADAELTVIVSRIAGSCQLNHPLRTPRPNALLTLRPPSDLEMGLKT